MYAKKTPKTQAPDNNLFTLHYPHAYNLEKRNQEWEEHEFTQYISLDPAIKNLAIRVEKRYKNGKIECLFTDKYAPLEDEKITINNKEILSNKLYVNIINILSKLEQYFPETHYVIVERQLPQNIKATRVMQQIICFFMLSLQNKHYYASIIEVDPKLKGKMLGAPKGCRENELKKWAIVKALELAEMRNDEYTLKILNTKRLKKDDLADVLCQIEGFCVYMNLPETERL
jgi:hypothetical protein